MKRIIALILTAVTVAALSGTASAVSEYEDLNSFGNAKVAYGMGVELDADNRPLGAVTAQNQYGEMGAFFIGDSTEKRLWLTFDEGYENGYTSDILDTLKEKNVKAVFFVTYDYAEKNPDLIKRKISEGHTVGKHT